MAADTNSQRLLPGSKNSSLPGDIKAALATMMALLLERVKDTETNFFLHFIFRQRVQERVGSEGDALALAIRVLAFVSVSIRNETDLRMLLDLQQEDDGWETGINTPARRHCID